MNTSHLKQKIQIAFEGNQKISGVALITVLSIAFEIILFLANNCDLVGGLMKNSCKKKGFLYRKFLKTQVYPRLSETDLSEEEKEFAIEKIRQMIINDELIEFVN